jgi:predicted ATPase with chaperone activity
VESQGQDALTVAISRATGTLTFAANFVLVAAMDRCGHHGDLVKECASSPSISATTPRVVPLVLIVESARND